MAALSLRHLQLNQRWASGERGKQGREGGRREGVKEGRKRVKGGREEKEGRREGRRERRKEGGACLCQCGVTNRQGLVPTFGSFSLILGREHLLSDTSRNT